LLLPCCCHAAVAKLLSCCCHTAVMLPPCCCHDAAMLQHAVRSAVRLPSSGAASGPPAVSRTTASLLPCVAEAGAPHSPSPGSESIRVVPSPAQPCSAGAAVSSTTVFRRRGRVQRILSSPRGPAPRSARSLRVGGAGPGRPPSRAAPRQPGLGRPGRTCCSCCWPGQVNRSTCHRAVRVVRVVLLQAGRTRRRGRVAVVPVPSLMVRSSGGTGTARPAGRRPAPASSAPGPARPVPASRAQSTSAILADSIPGRAGNRLVRARGRFPAARAAGNRPRNNFNLLDLSGA
jgi:hypothetical protein